MTVHFGSPDIRWECISEEDTQKARSLAKPPQRPLRDVRCLLCRDSPEEAGPLTLSDLGDHLERFVWSFHITRVPMAYRMSSAHELNKNDITRPGADGTLFTRKFWDREPIPIASVKMVPMRGR